jgi:hypothetical protein
VLDE